MQAKLALGFLLKQNISTHYKYFLSEKDKKGEKRHRLFFQSNTFMLTFSDMSILIHYSITSLFYWHIIPHGSLPLLA